MVNARALRARGTSVPHGFESHPRRFLLCKYLLFFFFSFCVKFEHIGGPREGSMVISESYELVIECKDETDQKAKFDQLTAQGYAVRVLNL